MSDYFCPPSSELIILKSISGDVNIVKTISKVVRGNRLDVNKARTRQDYEIMIKLQSLGTTEVICSCLINEKKY